MTRNRGMLSVFEGLLIIVSLILVSQVGTSAHRWMWQQAELLQHRAIVRDVANTVRAMRVRALSSRRPFELRIDAHQGRLQLLSIHHYAGGRSETVERTFWLPKGLVVNEAPERVTVSPGGELSGCSVVFASPSYSRVFRLTTANSGAVRLDEEPTL